MHVRIRRRREERGIPAYVLAKELDISPSYISLIESGKKVPSEDIARRIAAALEDDVEMYVAWAHSAGIDDIDSYTQRLQRLRRHSSDPALRRQLGSGKDIEELLDARQEAKPSSRSILPGLLSSLLSRREPESHETAQLVNVARLEHGVLAEDHTLAEVPLLDEGADPADPERERRLAGLPLRLDARLFAGEDVSRLFAYRATRAMALRTGEAVCVGDWVILTSVLDMRGPQSLFAVRMQGRIVLSRVLVKGSSLLLLPPPESSDFEIVELRSDDDLGRVLAGRVLMTLRGMGEK